MTYTQKNGEEKERESKSSLERLQSSTDVRNPIRGGWEERISGRGNGRGHGRRVARSVSRNPKNFTGCRAERDLIERMSDNGIEVACIQETHRQGSGDVWI